MNGAQPLVLASQSLSRQAMLTAAGVSYAVVPAEIDERAIEGSLKGTDPAHVARSLAAAKALAVSQAQPGRLVLGSDSLVVVDGQRFDKPTSRDDAARHLAFFSGQTMHLHSAAAFVRDGALIWQDDAAARLHVRQLSDAFITEYLAQEWPAVKACVGVFRLEGMGVQLFDTIAGDQFTVLGMPLLAVLAQLRAMGMLLG